MIIYNKYSLLRHIWDKIIFNLVNEPWGVIMQIQTRDFGAIEIDKEEIIEFPEGIPGFLDEKQFVLLPLDEESSFIIMQSVNTQNLAFITIEPKNIISNYEFNISDKTEKLLKIKGIEDIILLNVVNIRDSIEDMTINLAAPLIINIKENLGKQVILDNSKYPVKFKFETEDDQTQEQSAEEMMG